MLAKRMAALLAKIPTVQFIGVSGGLALLNADREDDIDFFIVTKKNTVWTTRLFVVLFLELIGKRRRRGTAKVSDSICVNMFLDEQKMQLPKEWRDLYLAHEVVQVLPLFSRQNTYEKFLLLNNWVDAFLPHAVDRGTTKNYTRNNVENLFSVVLCGILQRYAFEHAAKKLQQWYMSKHRTREVVSDTILAFHPIDYRGNTLKAFEKRIDRYAKV